jgi:ubiquinone/menaquinone biosynthesis C-methylase UbiE
VTSEEQDVVRHYEGILEEERITLGLGRLELLRTREVLERHLPNPPVSILDVGGGAGVHAAWLSDAGHRVHVVDLTPRHVRLIQAELGSKGVTAEVGDARSLAVADNSFEVVLLLGPLYHLTNRADRIRALREARRAVGAGGMIAIAAINRFASLFDGLSREFLFDPAFRRIVERDLIDGQHRNPSGHPNWFTTAYFHHPDELPAEAREAGLRPRELVGVEGLAGWLPRLGERWESEEGREAILYAARAVEQEPTLMGLSSHLLLIAEPQAS